MSKRSINDIIRDAVNSRNAELDKKYGYGTKPIQSKTDVVSAPRKIKSTIPTGGDFYQENKPNIVKFTEKHAGKWAVLSQERIPQTTKFNWRVLSVHDDFDDTLPEASKSTRENFIGPMYIDNNLHKHNLLDIEKFL